jgi:hypothetical protein
VAYHSQRGTLGGAVYSFTLFVCCMVCHGELYGSKPASRYVTSFYLMVALGGATGGIFVALIAPHLFNNFWEYQLGFLVRVDGAQFRWRAQKPDFGVRFEQADQLARRDREPGVSCDHLAFGAGQLLSWQSSALRIYTCILFAHVLHTNIPRVSAKYPCSAKGNNRR